MIRIVEGYRVKSFSEINNDNKALQDYVNKVATEKYRTGQIPKKKEYIYRQGVENDFGFIVSVAPGRARPSAKKHTSYTGRKRGRKKTTGINAIEVSVYDSFDNKLIPIETFYSLKEFNEWLNN